MDAMTDTAGLPREPVLEVCSGDLFAVDGAVECLRRQTGRRVRP